jgi:hypothetical protein
MGRIFTTIQMKNNGARRFVAGSASNHGRRILDVFFRPSVKGGKQRISMHEVVASHPCYPPPSPAHEKRVRWDQGAQGWGTLFRGTAYLPNRRSLEYTRDDIPQGSSFRSL